MSTTDHPSDLSVLVFAMAPEVFDLRTCPCEQHGLQLKPGQGSRFTCLCPLGCLRPEALATKMGTRAVEITCTLNSFSSCQILKLIVVVPCALCSRIPNRAQCFLFFCTITGMTRWVLTRRGLNCHPSPLYVAPTATFCRNAAAVAWSTWMLSTGLFVKVTASTS